MRRASTTCSNRRVGTVARETAQHFEYCAARLVARLAGLTDEEYLWEPVSGCWSVRPDADGVWRPDLGPLGTTWTPPPEPFTTIAWRLWHLGASPSPSWPPHDVRSPQEFAQQYFTQSARASEGVSDAATATLLVAANWEPIPALIESFDEDALLAPMGEMAGPYADASAWGLLLHVADELIHHSAEVGVLRDLYRAQVHG